MTDLMNEMTQRMMSEMREKRDAFIKEMLIKKGYPELAEITEMVRFPKINRTICDGWEYIFVDDGSKQGKFIVAIGWWEPDTKFNLVKSPELVSFCQTTYTFKWQDSNFDAVRL